MFYTTIGSLFLFLQNYKKMKKHSFRYSGRIFIHKLEIKAKGNFDIKE